MAHCSAHFSHMNPQVYNGDCFDATRMARMCEVPASLESTQNKMLIHFRQPDTYLSGNDLGFHAYYSIKAQDIGKYLLMY